ncbi:MAG: GWxTD domain-containing protein [Balneolales bacterium]|nr:GWxTD domain-containing protein [Balneolales bacterium]
MAQRLLFILALLLTVDSLYAQRNRGVDYINLINRSAAPQYFLDNVLLPTEDGKTNLSIIFRFDNDFLPYKKVTPGEDIQLPEGQEYYTIARLNAEIFEGRASRRARTSSDVNVVSRDLWIDTLYTDTFEKANSNKFYASGSLTTTLDPGQYNYVLQLSIMESTNDRNSENRNIDAINWHEKKTGEIYLGKALIEEQNSKQFVLANIGSNVWYSKDFYTLVRIPNYDPGTEYTLHIDQARIARRDTTLGESVYSTTLTKEHIMEGALPVMKPGKDPTISIEAANSDYTYALVQIPNSEFRNASYTIRLTSEDSEEPLARKFFRSYWQNMPASLLNLNIAIDHLKFILDEEQLREMKDGNPIEKERKFREFWDKRDPTPGTIYNELMAEYYRRIDYAFEEFSNRGNYAGHESDQGKVYISYGPPNEKDRQFPTDGKVIEIWKYDNRTFVFEATTGFGDFVLTSAEG